MYRICLGQVKNSNDYEELIRMFLPSSEYQLVDSDGTIDTKDKDGCYVERKDKIKKSLYEQLNKLTGKQLKWGTLTGVKPLKLYNNLLNDIINDSKEVNINNCYDEVGERLKTDYLVDDSKIDLLKEIHCVQTEVLEPPKHNQVSIYIGIPFCPTRCTYCSFTSNQKEYDEIKRYLGALYKEIDYVGSEMASRGLTAETVYIGGGTPTTLESKELQELIQKVNHRIPTADGFEFTVEAGRPDTIDDEKLKVLYENGVTRISINPQTMKEDTLRIMGRDHNNNQIRTAFDEASKYDFEGINADIITGLPGETVADFDKTLYEVAGFEPANITVHTLAIKKSSKLMERLYESEELPETGHDSEEIADKMVGNAEFFLKEMGYRPYYIYRQKYMADNLENVGYAKPGTECIYNIRIMEEKQTVIAVGAGGSTKVFFPEENRLERVMNVSNYELYIDRIDEMIDRKRKKLFDLIGDKSKL